MTVDYKKLWKLLIDKGMKKEDLRKASGITTTAMAKLGRNETVYWDAISILTERKKRCIIYTMGFVYPFDVFKL